MEVKRIKIPKFEKNNALCLSWEKVDYQKIKDLIKMELLKEDNLMITFQKNEINRFY